MRTPPASLVIAEEALIYGCPFAMATVEVEGRHVNAPNPGWLNPWCASTLTHNTGRLLLALGYRPPARRF